MRLFNENIQFECSLSQRQATELGRCLNEFNVMADDFKLKNIRRRQLPLENYFESTADKKMAYCPDVANLMEYFGRANYDPSEWILFIDSSTSSECCDM